MKILLWQQCQNQGMSLDKLSKLTGISRSTLYRIENGETSPTMYYMERLAMALNVKISDLYESQYK